MINLRLRTKDRTLWEGTVMHVPNDGDLMMIADWNEDLRAYRLHSRCWTIGIGEVLSVEFKADPV